MKRLLSILLCLSLVSCTGKSDIPDYSGRYELVRIESANDPISEEEMKEMRELGYDVTLEIYKDGTCTLDSFGKVLSMTYDARKMTMSSGDESSQFRYEDGLLFIEESDQTLVFSKSE